MKIKLTIFALFAFLFAGQVQAQDVTTVRANSSDISDNLDLKAVASIFGESEDLADFERRLNDPKIQISNLDLNGDNRVDYLRVIETVESNTHLIIIQAVLERDIFQDIATVEVERDQNNNIQVQVVGDTYIYGSNYIYEPVYVRRPVIFTVFWTNYYRPYYSPWYWSYYPSYYYAWDPYPIYRYRRNVHVHINVNNHYNYVNTRRSSRAVAMHSSRRADGYARQNPNRSFAQRNSNVSNRYELDRTRSASTRSQASTRAVNSSRVNSDGATRGTRNASSVSPVRSSSNSVRTSNSVRSANESGTRNSSVRSSNQTRTEAPSRNAASTRTNAAPARTSSERSTPTRTQSAPSRTQVSPARTERSVPRVQSSPSRGSASPASSQQRSAPSRNSGNSSRGGRG